MAHLQLNDVRKSYGAVDVIKGVDLEIESASSWSSSALRLRQVDALAADLGLEDITSGDMLFDNVRVNDLAPSSAASPWCSRATRSTRT